MTLGRSRRDRVLAAGPVASGLAAAVAALGWAGLVLLAVRAGRAARDGGGAAGWALTLVVAAAAAACLLAAFLLVARARDLAVRRRAQPAGRHRR